jgi:hypothetical protein
MHHDAEGEIGEEAIATHTRPGLRPSLQHKLAAAVVMTRPVGDDQQSETHMVVIHRPERFRLDPRLVT